MGKLFEKILIAGISILFCHLSLAESIKIGLVGPFSGPYVAAGDQQWQGAAQAVEDINKKGGINGVKLVLVNADDVCDPKKAVKVAYKFIKSDDIKAVIGHNCSSTTLAAAKIYSDANMLVITPASTASEITEHGYNTLFRTCGRDDSQAGYAAKFMQKDLKAHKVVVLHDNSLYGKGLAENTKTALNKLGINIPLYQGLTDDKGDYQDLIKTISKINPDVIFFGGLHTDAGNFLKQLREHGNQVTFFSGDGIASPDFVRSAGGPNMVKNVYMTFYKEPTSLPEAKRVVKTLEEKRIKPTGYILNAYAAVQVIAQALQDTQQKNMSINDWLRHNKVHTVIGTLEWDQKGDLKNDSFAIYKWNDEGEYELYN